MYQTPFRITKAVSNNAFSFEKRKTPSLYVPSLIEGDFKNVMVGDEVVFEDFDENETLKSCRGLRNFVQMAHPKTGKPIVVVDNHNHVFYFWHEAREKGWVREGATLVHIDGHKDTRVPDSFLLPKESRNLQKVFEYTNSVLNVGNYIPPALRDGLVGTLISITSEKGLTEYDPDRYVSEGELFHPERNRGISRLRRPHPTLILNLDLDFWAPELDYIDAGLKIQRTRAWMESADLITVATSPFFIDQGLALRTLGGLLGL